VDGERFIFGTPEFVASFPNELPDAISNTTERLLGIPIPPPQIIEALDHIKFERPAGHKEKVSEIEFSVRLYLAMNLDEPPPQT
jgi:hypothetical protein